MAETQRRSAADKLGIRGGYTVLLIGANAGWQPEGLSPETVIRRVEGPDEATAADLVVAFVRAAADLAAVVECVSAVIYPDGALWVAWPRRAAGHLSDVTDRRVREVALAYGLVDVKVAAIDEDWSGLRLVWRLERRNDRKG